MNIKSLLLGSAAALAAVSGAQAADAIVAAAPEPMEYVRVCDAFGTGYFYIPGTETCLKIGGEIRASIYFGDSVADSYNYEIRSRINISTMMDSEVGTIGTFVRLQATTDSASNARATTGLDQAYITVGGLKVGRAATFWDDIGLTGENDAFTADTVYNQISYTYAADAFALGVGVDDLSSYYETAGDYSNNEVGVQGKISGKLGGASLALYGVYDFGAEEGAVALQGSVEVGPGSLEAYGAWSSGISAYADVSEWTVGAAYNFKATDKLTITPSVQYWDGLYAAGGDNGWSVGVIGQYTVATGLVASATVNYFSDTDVTDDAWTGFVRLTRSF